MNHAGIKNQVYNLEAEYQLTSQRLDNDKQISPENKQTIKQFVQDKMAMGVIQKTRATILIDHLRRLSRLTSKNFQRFEEKDLKNLLRSLGKPESWLKGIVNKAAPLSRGAEELLTEEDMLAMIEAAPSLQYKAMLALLFETGIRPGELLLLRLQTKV